MTAFQKGSQKTRSNMPSKTDPVLILGAGAWGLSMALHLHNQGYSNITVFDRADEIPSPYSAAYDPNKIVQAEHEDPFYTELALVGPTFLSLPLNATTGQHGWIRSLTMCHRRLSANGSRPFFGPYYHQTGYIVATTGRAPQKAIDHLHKALESVAKHPVFKSEITSLDSGERFNEVAWQFMGPLHRFSGYFNRLAGYAHSSNATKGIWSHLAAHGVKFVLGEEHGRVVELLYSIEGRRRCTGIRTASGQTHTASTVVMALGAWAASLLPEIGHSAVARCWSVAHVQLTQAECDYLRFIPTTNVRDLGFIFEPDPERKLFKLCPLGAGYTNTQKGISLPPNGKLPPPQDFIPAEDEQKLRQLPREVFPWMADRPFVEKRLCWFADTRDSEYCIDFVPDTGRSLVVLSGDSGHGFKMMPIFGKWVTSLLEASEQSEQRWQWREHGSKGEIWGDEVSWRIGKSRELSELIKEKQRLERARL